MKNPLRKRLLRELRNEFGKYLVIFLLLTCTISFVSGFLVADGSMLRAYEDSFTTYRIEDGHFRLASKANRAQIKKIQNLDIPITLYDNFYVEDSMDNQTTLRIFENRTEVNLVCLMQGQFPEKEDEIAIDRMYADNNHLTPGDTLSSDDHTYTITGLVALSDYSCLFSDNNDSMFDSVQFGVAVVTPEAFSSYPEENRNWCYSWIYDNPPANEDEERDLSEDLLKELSKEVSLEDYVPQYENQAIQFTGEDMGSDKAMMIALLYIVMVIIAFVFGITITSTIQKEAAVIGTLRALGYTKGELVRHYLSAPLLVTTISALLGNLLGYTFFKQVCVDMYYGSYSLPTYVTIWSAEAFLLTTVIPFLLMLLITAAILWYQLALPPLKFLRRDLSHRRSHRALPLSGHLPFFFRFHLRVLLQNMSSYLILWIGILFANLLLLFGLIFPSILSHYQEELEQNMLCNYQYILQVPFNAMQEDKKLQSLLYMIRFQQEVETSQENAEKFTAYSLKTTETAYPSEEVLLYGIQPDSLYLPLSFSGDGVYISSAYADKFALQPGDTITLKEAYEDHFYDFSIEGIYDYTGALAIFLPQEQLNDLFDLGDSYFSGYFSQEPITDIDEKYIGSVIDLEALTKISRQLDVSMGSMMYLVDAFSILMFLVLIYLLSRTIIEKNARSISMVKILGYRDSEICRLYILSTSVVVIIFLLLSLPIEYRLMEYIFRVVMLTSISGWIPFYMDSSLYVQMFGLGLGAYCLVLLPEYRKIRRIPMDEILKYTE